MAQLKLTDTDAAVLFKRIRKLVERARYYPATVGNMDAAAFEVIRPYVSKEFASSREPKAAGPYCPLTKKLKPVMGDEGPVVDLN